jgi:hypothetical protein
MVGLTPMISLLSVIVSTGSFGRRNKGLDRGLEIVFSRCDGRACQLEQSREGIDRDRKKGELTIVGKGLAESDMIVDSDSSFVWCVTSSDQRERKYLGQNNRLSQSREAHNVDVM